MIPRANIVAWRKAAPWADDAQVEQDLALSRAVVEKNLHAKGTDPAFLDDMPPLLAEGIAYDSAEALHQVHRAFIQRIPGGPWRGPQRR